MQSYTTVGINSKSLWEGIVRIDNNFDDYVSSITDHEGYNQLTIEDVKFHHLSYYTFENIPNIKNLPNVIIVMVYGKTIQEYMKCTAILGYEKIEKIKGFFRKTKYFEDVLRIKGFKLEPITSIPESPVPCLTSYRADIGKDNAFDISQQGIITFSTGSHSAESQLDSARQSLTCVFVASNEKPFVASVRKKGSIFTMKCDNNGIDEESHDKGKELEKNRTAKPNENPLEILKIRLAKGEITKEEYEEMKSVLK